MKDDAERKPEEKEFKKSFQNIHSLILQAIENQAKDLDLTSSSKDIIPWGAIYFDDEIIDKILTDCPNLVSIKTGIPHSLEEIKCFSKFHQLKKLHIKSVYHRLDDLCLLLSLLPNLTHLTLETGYWLGDEFHNVLSKLPNLQFLEFFDFERMRIEDFNRLSELKQLKGLRLEEISFDPKEEELPKNRDLKPLAPCPQFKYLEMSFFSICDASAKLIASLSNLETLISSASAMTDKGFYELQKLEKLKTLHLESCHHLTKKSFKALNLLHSLEELSLESCFRLTNQGLEAICSIENLKVLRLDYCSKVSKSGWDQIQKLPNLEVLILEHCSIKDHSPFMNLPKLKKLGISDNLLSEKQLAELAKNSCFELLPKGAFSVEKKWEEFINQ